MIMYYLTIRAVSADAAPSVIIIGPVCASMPHGLLQNAVVGARKSLLKCHGSFFQLHLM